MTIAMKSVVAASLLLMLGVSSALAMDIRPPRGGNPGNPGGGGPAVCVGTCQAPVETLASNDCGGRLLNLPRITGRQIAAIGGAQKVRVTPVCETATGAIDTAKKREVDLGNVAGLLGAIEGNHLLVSTLRDRGYRSADVIGILLGPQAAIVYVHKA